ncbi:MAG: hypothetical protein WCK00_11345 [Deltaproteobacteria bacterium]
MSIWVLDDLSEQIDIQEDNDQITKVRQHFTIQIRTQIKCSDIPSRGDIGKRMASITYTVGSLTATKEAPTGCMFLCVADGFTPLEHPGDYCVRRQTWESFGKFITAPAEWNK